MSTNSDRRNSGSQVISLEEAREIAEKLRRKKNPTVEDKLRQQQFELRMLFDEDDIDWEKFLEYQTAEGISPNFVQPSSLMTTLHLASYANQAQVVHWCVTTDADVDAKSTLGRTPLHFACDGNATRCIRLLLDARADPNAVSLSLMTPLHISCRNGNCHAVLVLLESDRTLDVNATDSKHRRADMLTKDANITRAIEKYRSKLDGKRKQDLIEHKLQRLFKMFDVDGTGRLNESEWTRAQAILAEYFEECCEDAINLILGSTDKDDDKFISFEEFRSSQLELMAAAGSSHNKLMANLTDMENRLFEESQVPSLQREATSELQAMRQKSRATLEGA
jgi:ankyrin repeat protein